jgi:hypothetical protein
MANCYLLWRLHFRTSFNSQSGNPGPVPVRAQIQLFTTYWISCLPWSKFTSWTWSTVFSEFPKFYVAQRSENYYIAKLEMNRNGVGNMLSRKIWNPNRMLYSEINKGSLRLIMLTRACSRIYLTYSGFRQIWQEGASNWYHWDLTSWDYLVY